MSPDTDDTRFRRPLHGQLHQEEPPGFPARVPEPFHQPHTERPVRRLHAVRRAGHEEARARSSCPVEKMCAGENPPAPAARLQSLCKHGVMSFPPPEEGLL